ncbi:unnamed protein product [Amoebophrya sp. A120]|nr:unnamed protein product [Amoebophrya sp. A120]|eukprot:GSA120T00005343001.1
MSSPTSMSRSGDDNPLTRNVDKVVSGLEKQLPPECHSRLKQNAFVAAESEIQELGEQVFDDPADKESDNFFVITEQSHKAEKVSGDEKGEFSKSGDGAGPTAETTDPQGLGLAAKRDIPRYSVVFQDKPVLKHDADKTEFNLEACQNWFWKELNDTQMEAVLQLKCNPRAGVQRDGDSSALEDLNFLAATKKDGENDKATQKPSFKTLSPEELTHLLDLKERGFPTEEESTLVRDYIRQNYVVPDSSSTEDTGFKKMLESAPDAVQQLAVKMAYGAVRTNSIREDNFILLFPLLSRVNHGCRPNLWQQNGVVLALRDIQEGEELFWCYPQGKVLDEWQDTAQHFLFLDWKNRQDYLHRLYDFKCRCVRCSEFCSSASSGPSEAQFSEENARLIPLRQGFTELTQFINKAAPSTNSKDTEEADGEDWRSAMELCAVLENALEEENLSLDIKLLAQMASLRAVYASAGLLAAHDGTASGIVEPGKKIPNKNAGTSVSEVEEAEVTSISDGVEASEREHLMTQAVDIAVQTVQKELMCHMLGYGATAKPVLDLTNVLGKLYYIQSLRQCVRMYESRFGKYKAAAGGA